MMRKSIFSLLLFLAVLTACSGIGEKTPDFYHPFETTVLHKERSHTIEAIEFPTEGMTSALVLNVDTGDILYDYNSDKSYPVASMSKMMSELIILEAIQDGDISWDELVPISEYAQTISTTLGIDAIPLDPDEEYTVEQLFELLVVRSSNGATIALAELVAGEEKAFVERMNERASDMGLTKSLFVNSSGLTNHDLFDYYATGDKDDSNHMSAQDVARLATHLLNEFPDLLTFTQMPSVDFKGETYESTNMMLPNSANEATQFTGVDGFKTGYTDEAGYCFTGSALLDDIRIVSIVMGTDSHIDRFEKTIRLYDEILDGLNKK